MSDFAIGRKGLELDAPSAGDIVTVKLKPCPRRDLIAGMFDESENPRHYRHIAIWRVIAANDGQAVVEQVTDGYYGKGRREVWAIDAHRWFEASELLKAIEEATAQTIGAERDA